MNIKGWIEKRLQEIKSDNVIVLDNWREYYNNKQKKEKDLMTDDYDFGAWLIEDLKEHYKYLMKQRDRSEMYSDRAELNNMILIILSEIQSRERNL